MCDLATYGFTAKKLLSELFLLPGGPLILILAGLWIARRRRAFGLVLALVATSVLLVFSMPLVANAIAVPAEREFPPLSPDLPMPPRAAIVVLGGGLQSGATDFGGETVNTVTLARLRSASRLAKRTGLPVLVTGGRPCLATHSEAELMAGVLEHDFQVKVRWIEGDSLDTADNASMSVPILRAAGIETAVIVTDVEHMHRSRTLFEAAGMPVLPAATDYYATAPTSAWALIPTTSALRRSNWSLHEWIGTLWIALRA